MAAPRGAEFSRRWSRVYALLGKRSPGYEAEKEDFLALAFFSLLERVLTIFRMTDDAGEPGFRWEEKIQEVSFGATADRKTLAVSHPFVTGDWWNEKYKDMPAEPWKAGSSTKFDSGYLSRWWRPDLFGLLTGFMAEDPEGGGPPKPWELKILPNESTAAVLEASGGSGAKASSAVDRYVKYAYRTLNGINPFSFSASASGTNLETGKNEKGTVSVEIGFEPLRWDTDPVEGTDEPPDHAFYPVFVKTSLRRVRPSTWKTEEQETLLVALVDALEARFPERIAARYREDISPLRKRDEKLPPLVPTVAKVRVPSIRSPLHFERQKFGKEPPVQGSLFDDLELDMTVRADVDEHKVSIVGVDLSAAQGHALHAIQTLLEGTGYRGNLKEKELSKESNSFLFSGSLPVLRFTVPQYLEAYGLTRRKRPDREKMEFLPNERAEALSTLRELAAKRFLLVYERRYWDKAGVERFDVVRTVRPLFNIVEGWEALSRGERNTVTAGGSTDETEEKLRALAIEPSPIFVDQIEGYHVLKPANFRQEIRLLVSHASRYVYNFAEYLMVTAEDKRRAERLGKEAHPDVHRIREKVLAYKLRMDAWVKNRQWKQIRGSLTKCCETAKALGYLTGYAFDTGATGDVVELHLNLEKFRRAGEAQGVKVLPAPASGE